jgi:hypothetical protein
MLDKLGFRKGLRTIVVNFFLMIPVIADVVIQVLLDPQFGTLIPQTWYPLYTFAVLVVNAYLRTITTTPVGKRE